MTRSKRRLIAAWSSGPVLHACTLLQHFRLAIRLVDRHAHVALDAPDFERAGGAGVEQADERFVQQIDPFSQILEVGVHDVRPFSQRS